MSTLYVCTLKGDGIVLSIGAYFSALLSALRVSKNQNVSALAVQDEGDQGRRLQ